MYSDKLINYLVYIGYLGCNDNIFNIFRLYFSGDISKVSLQKNLKPNKSRFTRMPNVIKHDKKQKISKFCIKKQYSICLNNFVHDIKACIPYVSLDLFYENSIGLKIIEYSKINEKSNLVFASADYFDDGREKAIRVYNGKDYIPSLIYHELFHMATTKLQEEACRSGFYYCDLDFCLGEGLNEGYTELMTMRYFGNYMSEKEEEVSSYPVLVSIAYLLEKYFIGKERMQKLYFGLDLPNLIEILKEYDSESNVMSFLRKIDYLNLYNLNTLHVFRKTYYLVLKDVIETINRWKDMKINTDYLNNQEICESCKNHMEFLEEELDYRKKLMK